MTNELPNAAETGWKSQAYLVGGLLGLVVGLLAAYLYARASEENSGSPTRIKAVDALKLSVGVMGVIRQITDLGASGGK
ncbi:MAG: hypothetical protein JXJ20_07845 [Anaerolineae bacterium]|jgi:hypothetical protein|nr:hypothetical protein [Anaerolineae bacterium]